MALPDFSTMSHDELVEWFSTHDATEFMAKAEVATQPMVQVDENGEPVKRPVTVRLPPSMIEWLDRAAGRDREGRSGIVRRALQEFRERNPGLAA
jgi:hypothetical protein